MDAQQLESLRSALVAEGLRADIRSTARGTSLKVANPEPPGLDVTVMVRDGNYVWEWGAILSPVSELSKAVEGVMFVLRGPSGSPADLLPPE
ncbi:unnamed protein product [[Actinomadura] parvosata subsp. kistnae]|nr:unnamed protein product [Actinomadura parvosata subsp. kistnae]